MKERDSNGVARQASKWSADAKATRSSHISLQQPRIEPAGNRWRSEKTLYEDEEEGLLVEGDCCPSLTRNAVHLRRYKRMFMILFLLLGLALWAWKWYLRPRLEMEEGFKTDEDGPIGIAKGSDFMGTRIQDLDTQLLPGGEDDPQGNRRLVFVGDIHGCAHELKKLLEKVHFDEKRDHLVAVGDVISKGPDNVGVLDELIRLGATSVRGNHEDRLLAMAPSILQDGLAPSAEASSNRASKDAALLRHLSKKHLKYLHGMPLMLRIPPLPMADVPSYKSSSPLAEQIIVVHAGLVPGITLAKQAPYFVMNMRSIGTKSHAPFSEEATKKSESKPWHAIWNFYNDRLFRRKSVKDFMVWHELEDVPLDGWRAWFGMLGLRKIQWPKPQVVVYGHHSKEGLQLHRWSKGLDTGCVRGEELTAMVLDARGNWSIHSVGCKDYR